jgi:hypothetical protein
MLLQLFSIIAPVMICIGVGVIWGRRPSAFDTEFVTALVTSIGAPALVFHTLATLSIDLRLLRDTAFAVVLAMLITGIVALALLRAAGWPLRPFLPALLFPNTGNMGLPLSLLAFGEQGLALAVGTFALHLVGQFTVGVAIASGSFSPRPLLRSPLLWAAPAGALFPVTGVALPGWIASTADLIGGMTIPLMLITLGVSLVRLPLVAVRRSLVLAVMRPVLGVGCGLAAAAAVGVEGLARDVMLLQLAMPIAVFNYLFAQRYNTRPDEVAGAVIVSTMLSVLVLPAVLVWLL